MSLRAGPLTATLDRGELRWIRLDGREVLRGIYPAVRDPSWLTVPARIEGLGVDAGEQGFSVSFRAHYETREIRFAAETRIEGAPDGTIRYVHDGRALSTFDRNRVGLCVLHPTDGCAGRPCLIEHGDGRLTLGSFPSEVAPHQPFLDVRRIRHAVAPGRLLEVEVDGDWFEVEDQRNWSDASFKTYATHVGLPLPARLWAGDRVRHEVVVRLVDGELPPLPARDRRPATAQVAPTPSSPRVGLALAAAPPSAQEIERVRLVRADHLRVDVHLGRPEWTSALVSAVEAARACGIALVPAVFAGDSAERELHSFRNECARLDAPVECPFVFREATHRSDPALLALARTVGLAAERALGGGAAGPFADVNRNRRAVEGADRVAFELCPQVHARDEATILENLTSMPDVARSARAFAPAAALWLSPVRFALAAHGPDPRLTTPFAGPWVAGLLAAAARAGVEALTFAQAFGTHGLLAGEALTPAAAALRDRAGPSV